MLGSGGHALVWMALFLSTLAQVDSVGAAHDEPRGTLFGTLLDTNGAPIVGADMIVVRDYQCNATTCTKLPRSPHSERVDVYTDANGTWRTDIPAGGFHVVGRHDVHWPRDALTHVEKEVRLTLRPGQVREMNMTLDAAPAPSVTVGGHVVDAHDGRPIPEARVSLWNYELGDFGGASTTDADGKFEAVVRPGRLFVLVTVEDYTYGPCPGSTSDVPSTSTTPPPASSDASPQTPYPETTTTSPTQGPEVCPVQTLDFSYHSFRRHYETEPNRAYNWTLELTRAASPEVYEGTTAEVAGWVVDGETNEPVAGAFVAAFNEAVFEWGYAQTDGNGSYRLGVTAGHLILRMAADGVREQFHEVHVDDGETVQWNAPGWPGPRVTCCFGWVESYEIPESGPAPPPPPRFMVAPQVDVMYLRSALDARVAVPNWWDYDWEQTFTLLEPGLGPYNPDADLNSRRSAAVETAPLLPPTFVVLAFALVFLVRRD